MTPNPFQGLKHSRQDQIHRTFTVSMTPNPFQGLKQTYFDYLAGKVMSLNDP